jgi:predicted permease
LAFGGGLLAMLVARAAMYVLMHAGSLGIPSFNGEPGTWQMNAVVMGLALASTAVFSLLPALVILNKRRSEMRLGGPSVGETVSHARVSRTLMIAQIAVAMVLVSAASVLMGTFAKLRSLPSGVEAKQLTVFQVALKGDRYANTQHTAQFTDRVLAQLRQTPGVDRAAAVNGLPLDRGLNLGGNPADRPELRQNLEVRAVTPDYFATMGMHVLAGRDLAHGDVAGGDQVVVISANTAKKWWPGRSPIGESVRIQGEKNWRIVGVVPDVQMRTLLERDNVVLYVPMAQVADELMSAMNGWFPTTFAVRTAAHIDLAEAAQRAVAQADAEIPVTRLETMQAVIDSTIEAPRFFSLLAAGFSTFSLVLTVIGLFGLLSFQVAQRTREIGVRMALGADRLKILRTIIGRGLAIAMAGVALGMVATWLVRPALARLLSDAGVDHVAVTEGIVVSGLNAAGLAAAAIFVVTLTASWLPARRAAAIEPMEALRTE